MSSAAAKTPAAAPAELEALVLGSRPALETVTANDL